MPILVHRLSLTALFLFCCFPPSSFSAPPASQQAILVLATDNYTYPYFFKLYSVLNETLKQDLKESFALYPESLDVNRLSSQAYRDQMHSLLQEKYRGTDIKGDRGNREWRTPVSGGIQIATLAKCPYRIHHR